MAERLLYNYLSKQDKFTFILNIFRSRGRTHPPFFFSFPVIVAAAVYFFFNFTLCFQKRAKM